MSNFNSFSLRASYPFWILCGFLALTFLLGGGSRDDVQSLVFLRPAAAICLAIGLWELRRDEVRRFGPLLVLTGLALLLTLLHLVPLPPSVWSSLPGREILVEADRLASIQAQWRPLTLAPHRAWNSVFAFLVPLAVLVLALRCSREQRFKLLPLLILLGLLSGLLGLLQVIGPSNGPLYFYRITNHGAAVGLFANRNHNSILLACLFPLLAVYASSGLKSVEQARLRTWVCMGLGVALVPLILVAGSRAGLLLGLLGLAVVPLVYEKTEFMSPPKRKVRRINPLYVIGGAAAIFLALITVLLARARAFERLLDVENAGGLRWTVWQPIWDSAGKYFPVGSGIGSFVEAYQVDEPSALLSPTYLNHAHNDWLELMMTGGAPALILAAAAIGLWFVATWKVLRSREKSRDIQFAKLGSFLVFALAAASVADYPLRVPSLAALFAVAAVWLAAGARGAGPQQGRGLSDRPAVAADDRYSVKDGYA